jgi:RNA polymerase sigma-70 factor (ECF subfamily)
MKTSHQSNSGELLEHIDALFAYAMTLTRNRIEAEDLVQETYVRAVRKIGDLAPESNLRNWLFVVMRNAWLNQIRHQSKRPQLIEPDETEMLTAPANDSNPQVVYLRKLEQAAVKKAIENLPLAYREVVLLRDIEGFSYQEIADILDCPAGTVMSRLGRARDKLRQLLASWKPKTRARAV